MKEFNINDMSIRNQFDYIQWLEDSGICEEELRKGVDNFTKDESDLPKAIIKAKTFEFIVTKSRIAIDKNDIFQDKVFGTKLMGSQRWFWEQQVLTTKLKDLVAIRNDASECFAYGAIGDYGHTSPNSKLLLDVGFTGLLERINEYYSKEGLTEKQKTFYESCKIYLEAILHFIRRLADAIRPYNEENSIALYNISKGKPSNTYEAMQLLIVYFFLHEYIGCTRVRTLGRLDVLLYPFYKNDIENKTFTQAEIKEMIKYFFNKFWSAKVAYDLPLCLGGLDEDGNEVTNEFTYLLVKTYNELDIHSPKIHVRVSDKTPDDFLKLVLECIRGGNSSFVFLGDNTTIKSLVNVGIKEKDAMNYVPIGCYEPAVWGKEHGCTGNGGINLAKAIEFAITGGMDLKRGKQISLKTGEAETFEEFVSIVKEHIKYMADEGTNYICEIEKYYGEISPDPLLSSMYDRCVQKGVDIFEGGAEYNNSSYGFAYIASLVDSVCAVKRLVFEEKRVTYAQLCEILKNNWKDNEKLRLIAQNIPEKYGNNNPVADEITKDFSEFCASIINNRPNGRGGVFKANLFSIDGFVKNGKNTMATPEGRLEGEVLSKNLCATVGKDKNGITALINSATQIDHTLFPNGIVLDVVLHPSAVNGDSGLDVFCNLLKTYLRQGGMALHGNVFNSQELIKAQKNPEKYKNLQVRVCGWNSYFVNLSKEEQDCFIKQAENV